jgi:hypothetical protein
MAAEVASVEVGAPDTLRPLVDIGDLVVRLLEEVGVAILIEGATLFVMDFGEVWFDSSSGGVCAALRSL